MPLKAASSSARAAASCSRAETVQGTVLIDRMHRRPHQHEHDALRSPQGQGNQPPHAMAFAAVLIEGQEEFQPGIDDGVAPLVRQPEHERGHPVVGVHRGHGGEADAGDGAGEAGEGQAGGEGDEQQSHQGFGAHQQVHRQAGGVEHPVADRAERLHAEEEGIAEPGRSASRHAADPSGIEQIQPREDQVHQPDRPPRPWPGTPARGPPAAGGWDPATAATRSPHPPG